MPNKIEDNKHKSIKQREQLERYLEDFEEETKLIENLAKQLDEISSKYIDKKK